MGILRPISYQLSLFAEVYPEWGDMAVGEEAVDVGLGVPVFVAVAGVAEKAVVAEAFQVAVFDAEEGH